MINKIIVLSLVALCTFNSTSAQSIKDSSNINYKSRRTALLTALPTTYVASIIGFNELWYKNNGQTSFHFFNDNKEWKMMDKAGHAYFAFHVSRLGSESFRWAGFDKRKSDLYGALVGFAYQTPIEILDGFSDGYGASWGDIIANGVGIGLYLGQSRAWNEIRIMPKFSFHNTHYSSIRPALLGQNTATSIFKDYNGQTYWLSGNISSFLNASGKFPKWLCVSLGYNAFNMVYGHEDENIENGYGEHKNKLLLSLDVDWRYFKGNNKWLNSLLFLVNSIKLPFPALELNEGKLGFKPLYF